VLILDSSGTGVEGAEVTGSWSGAYKKTGVTATTDNSGNAVFETGYKKTTGIFTFCVDDVVKTDWTYDYSANVDDCDSIPLY